MLSMNIDDSLIRQIYIILTFSSVTFCLVTHLAYVNLLLKKFNNIQISAIVFLTTQLLIFFQQNKDTARQPVITANSHRKPSMYVLLLYYPGEHHIFLVY